MRYDTIHVFHRGTHGTKYIIPALFSFVYHDMMCTPSQRLGFTHPKERFCTPHNWRCRDDGPHQIIGLG